MHCISEYVVTVITSISALGRLAVRGVDASRRVPKIETTPVTAIVASDAQTTARDTAPRCCGPGAPIPIEVRKPLQHKGLIADEGSVRDAFPRAVTATHCTPRPLVCAHVDDANSPVAHGVRTPRKTPPKNFRKKIRGEGSSRGKNGDPAPATRVAVSQRPSTIRVSPSATLRTLRRTLALSERGGDD